MVLVRPTGLLRPGRPLRCSPPMTTTMGPACASVPPYRMALFEAPWGQILGLRRRRGSTPSFYVLHGVDFGLNTGRGHCAVSRICFQRATSLQLGFRLKKNNGWFIISHTHSFKLSGNFQESQSFSVYVGHLHGSTATDPLVGPPPSFRLRDGGNLRFVPKSDR